MQTFSTALTRITYVPPVKSAEIFVTLSHSAPEACAHSSFLLTAETNPEFKPLPCFPRFQFSPFARSVCFPAHVSRKPTDTAPHSPFGFTTLKRTVVSKFLRSIPFGVSAESVPQITAPYLEESGCFSEAIFGSAEIPESVLFHLNDTDCLS